MDEHRLLKDDGSAVADLGDEVHRGSRHLHPAFQHRFMDVQPIVTLAAEGGNQRGMDIHHFVREGAADHLIHNGHKPGVDHQIRLLLLERFQKRSGKGFGIGVFLPVDNSAWNPRLGGTL